MKGEIGSFSFDVAKRILNRLDEGDANRTNLATHTGLNYRTLVRYLNMLNSVGWTRFSGKGTVSITPLGREIRNKLVKLQLNEPEELAGEYSMIYELSAQQRLISNSSRTGLSMFPTTMAPSPAPKAERKTDSRTKNILIVDDEPDVALTYDMFLRSTGRYNVKVFTEPASALRDFVSNERHYDLVILDVRMRDINGLQMYQSMSTIDPKCKFLFVTSLDAVDELVSLLPKVDARGIVRKPIGKKHFVQMVEKLLFQN